MLDGTDVIGLPHLRAALALWDYAEASARFVFGDATGDPLADRILDALRTRAAPMSRTDISAALGRHVSADAISRALQSLQANGRVRRLDGPHRRPLGRTWECVP